VLGAEAGVDREQADEAAQQQPGADQQQHREGHLGHHQDTARAAAAGGVGARPLAQRPGEVRPAHLESGDQAGEEGRSDA
jgi:hypothetical protein